MTSYKVLIPSSLVICLLMVLLFTLLESILVMLTMSCNQILIALVISINVIVLPLTLIKPKLCFWNLVVLIMYKNWIFPLRTLSSNRLIKLRYLGIEVDENLTWESHVRNVVKSVASKVYSLCRLRHIPRVFLIPCTNQPSNRVWTMPVLFGVTVQWQVGRLNSDKKELPGLLLMILIMLILMVMT